MYCPNPKANICNVSSGLRVAKFNTPLLLVVVKPGVVMVSGIEALTSETLIISFGLLNRSAADKLTSITEFCTDTD